jgi:hypothetical protein
MEQPGRRPPGRGTAGLLRVGVVSGADGPSFQMRARHGTNSGCPVRDGVGTGWVGVGQVSPVSDALLFH